MIQSVANETANYKWYNQLVVLTRDDLINRINTEVATAVRDYQCLMNEGMSLNWQADQCRYQLF